MGHHQDRSQCNFSKTREHYFFPSKKTKYETYLEPCFGRLIAAVISFLNVSIIYKSYKCYSMTFIGKVHLLINLDRKDLVFQFITQDLFKIMKHVIIVLTYISRVKPFQFCLWNVILLTICWHF